MSEWPIKPKVTQHDDDFENGYESGAISMHNRFMVAIKERQDSLPKRFSFESILEIIEKPPLVGVPSTPSWYVFPGRKEALVEAFKLYSYEEIMNDGKRCFVVDVDGLICTLGHRYGQSFKGNDLQPIDRNNFANWAEKNGLNIDQIEQISNRICAKFGGQPSQAGGQVDKQSITDVIWKYIPTHRPFEGDVDSMAKEILALLASAKEKAI